MKQSFIVGAVYAFALALISTSSYATTITITPSDCDDFGGSRACDTGNETSNSDILDIIDLLHPGLTEVYKNNVDGSVDVRPFNDDYTTTYANTTSDPEDAWITWNGGAADYIVCPNCFVLIKDGNQSPAWYLFNINDWDGKMALHLEDFWVGNGAISHVAIFSSPIPVPAAVWLFGSGLLGLVGIARRKKA